MTCPRQCCTIPPSLYFHTPLPQDAMIHMRPHFPHKTVSLSLSLFLLPYVCVNMKAAVNLWWVKIKYRQSACFIFLPGHLHHLVWMMSSVFKRIKMNILNSTMNLWPIMLISSTKIHISTLTADILSCPLVKLTSSLGIRQQIYSVKRKKKWLTLIFSTSTNFRVVDVGKSHSCSVGLQVLTISIFNTLFLTSGVVVSTKVSCCIAVINSIQLY